MNALGDAPKGYHAYYDKAMEKRELNLLGQAHFPEYPIYVIRTPKGHKIRARVTKLSPVFIAHPTYLGKVV